MKLYQIHESEYTGLEDNDEFGSIRGHCNRCGMEITDEDSGVWECTNKVCSGECGTIAHFSCAMPSDSDLQIYESQQEGVMSSGWYFQRQNAQGPFRQNHNILRGIRVLAATRAYDKYMCPECAEIRGKHSQITNESYEGLEDADEFEKDPEPVGIYGGQIAGTSVRWALFGASSGEQVALNIDINTVGDTWDFVDELPLETLYDLATWLGLNWSYRMSQEALVDAIMNKIYGIALRNRNDWNWPPEWGEPPQQPDWYY